jgi:hypothetical protein
MRDPDCSPYLADVLGGRRHFLGALAAGSAALLLPVAAFAQKSEIHDLRGTVRVNGRTVGRNAVIRPGDVVETGSDGYIVFIIGEDAFMLRSRSEVRIDVSRERSLLVASLRLVTGALGAVFKTGYPRSIKVMNVTAGIRGTGVYMETRGQGTYFCTCFGSVQLSVDESPNEREVIEATRHTPRLVHYMPRDGVFFSTAAFETHTDEEMDMLERCVGRRAPWISK